MGVDRRSSGKIVETLSQAQPVDVTLPQARPVDVALGQARPVDMALSHGGPVDLALVVTEKPLMRLELREVDGLDLTPPLVLAGIWAWLLFHEAGTLISYSDGYATRSACHAAAKQIAWPVNVFE